MPELSLPASVRSRACYSQLLGSWAIEPHFLDGGIAQVEAIGIEKIWQKNESLGDYPMFSPAIFDIAEQLGMAVSAPGPGDKIEMTLVDGKKIYSTNGGKTWAADGHGSADHASPPPYVVYKGTAIIPVSGPLSKMPTSLGHMFGGSSTVGMRKALALALNDPQVQRIMLHVDSPGGTVAGTGDLGDDLFAARQIKPTASYIEDLGASAAYWLASQTQDVYASPHAMIGSIGVYSVVYDTSERAKAAGVKVHVIKTGEFKGGGVPGTPITDAVLGKMQATVDAMHNSFVSNVARGRNMPTESIAKLADGNVFPALDAMKSGLIDAMGTFRAALDDFASQTPSAAKGAPTPLKRRKRSMTAPGYSASDKDLILITSMGTVVNDQATLAGFAAVSYTGQAIPSDALVTLMSTDPLAVASDFSPPSSQTGVDASAHESEDGRLYTGADIGGVGDTPMADPKTTDPAGSTPAAPPLSAVALEALQRDAALGRVAHEQLAQMQLTQAAAAKEQLASERERIMANYGTPKEDVLACADLASLRALENAERRHSAAGRTRAGAPKGNPDAKTAPVLPDATAELQKHLAKTLGINDGFAAYAPKPTGGA